MITAAVVALGATAPAAATPFACNRYGDLEICSGQVPSFDGSTLDVDVTKPMRHRGRGRHPLVVMLHGFGNDKHGWESMTDEGDGRDLWHWNSHWFARHGFYVLTYTARGFRTDAADDPWEPPTPAGTSASAPNGTIKLKSRDWEVKDTQWLAALAAKRFRGINPRWVAVTGNSYGAGESWLQASRPHWTFPHDATGGALPRLELQVAVPKYGWTDLAYSLAPNGRRVFDGPVGTIKLSYVNLFYEFGNQDGIFDPPVHAWKTRLADVGDPYEPEDPIVAQARHGLTEERSAYYQEDGWAAQAGGRKTAIFAPQGWTDDLFPADEALRQFRYLKALDPRWPVEVALGDVGHPRAWNKPGTWRWLNTGAFRFLRAHIRGSHEQATGISTEQSTCSPEPGPRLRGLGRATLTVPFASGGTLTWLGGSGDPDGLETDPIAGFIRAPDRCRVSVAPEWPGRYTAHSAPLPAGATYVGVGTVRIPYTLVGQTATLHARIWDVAPSGEAVFVDRGTYRLTLPSGILELPLFGNHWRFAPGHRIRLDLAQVDEPFLRRSNVPSSVTFAAPTLSLPIR